MSERESKREREELTILKISHSCARISISIRIAAHTVYFATAQIHYSEHASTKRYKNIGASARICVNKQ